MSGSRAAAPDKLERGAMGVMDIVFFVLAGVAPMGVVVALTVLAIALGNGAGVPGTYLVAGIILALFAIGYVRMSARVTNAGAFYAYATKGLGHRVGGATAYIAVLAYNATTIGVLGALAFFANQVMNSVVGIDLPWQAWALIAFAIVAVLSYFEVTLSAKVLGLALLCEVGILLAFDIGVLVQNGFHGFSLDVFKPSIVFGPGFGVTLMLAFGSYVGFEATALYGEEAKNPRKAVPRATYIALTAITVFYLVTTWAAISAYGVNHAQAAAGADPTGFLFAANAKYVGGFTNDAMQLLVITSLFAAFLAFHCNTARYHYALARDGLLPKALSHTHPKYGSPIIASAVQLAVVAIVVIAFAIAGQNPYLQMGTAFYGLGVLGIVLLQAIASTAVVGFFLKRKEAGVSKWGTIIAPALGALGLTTGLVFMIKYYPTLTGSKEAWINALPWLLVVAAALGAVVATVLRNREPVEYDHMGDERADLILGEQRLGEPAASEQLTPA
jgi:amino acid transporter